MYCAHYPRISPGGTPDNSDCRNETCHWHRPHFVSPTVSSVHRSFQNGNDLSTAILTNTVQRLRYIIKNLIGDCPYKLVFIISHHFYQPCQLYDLASGHIWPYTPPYGHLHIAACKHVALISEDMRRQRSKQMQDTRGSHDKRVSIIKSTYSPGFSLSNWNHKLNLTAYKAMRTAQNKRKLHQPSLTRKRIICSSTYPK